MDLFWGEGRFGMELQWDGQDILGTSQGWDIRDTPVKALKRESAFILG